jgi:hypothetical protein
MAQANNGANAYADEDAVQGGERSDSVGAGVVVARDRGAHLVSEFLDGVSWGA